MLILRLLQKLNLSPRLARRAVRRRDAVAAETLETRKLLSTTGGSLDSTFGNNGLAQLPDGVSGASGGTLQPDGKILLVQGRQLVRLTSDGEADTTFGTNGVTPTRSGNRAVAVQQDGSIIVGGTQGGFSVERFHSDGRADTTFGIDGQVRDSRVAGSQVWEVAVQSDGKVLAAGFGRGDYVVSRYLDNGDSDPTFGSDGVVQVSLGGSSNFAADMVLRPNGKILLIGGTGSFPGNGDFGIVQLNPDGSLDESFGNQGIVLTDINSESARSGALLPDGRLVVVGPGGGLGAIHLTRYLVDGSLDPAFGNDGVVVTPLASMTDNPHLALQGDGKVVVGATSSQQKVVIRYNTDGSIDDSFDSSARNRGTAEEVAIQVDGQIIIFGGMSVAGYVPGITAGVLSGQIWKDANDNGGKEAEEVGWNGQQIEILDGLGQVRSVITTQAVDVNGDGRIAPETDDGNYSVALAPGEWTVRIPYAADGITTGVSTDQIRQSAFRLDQKHDVRSTGKLFENAFGGGEKWLYARGGWLYVTPDGGVYRWTAQGTRNLEGDLLEQLDEQFHRDPQLIYEAVNPDIASVNITSDTQTSFSAGQVGAVSVSGRVWQDLNQDTKRTTNEPWINGQTVQLFDQQGNLIRSAASRDIEYHFDGRIEAETESGRYVFDGLRPGTYSIRRKQNEYEQTFPDPAAAQALQLNQQIGLRAAGSDFFNWGGQNEKWIWSRRGWHYITPDGTLRRWTGTHLLDGEVVAHLAPSYWQNTDLLTSPVDAMWEQQDVFEMVLGIDFGVR